MTITEQFLPVYQSLHRKYNRDSWIHTTRAPRSHERLPSQVFELTLRAYKPPSDWTNNPMYTHATYALFKLINGTTAPHIHITSTSEHSSIARMSDEIYVPRNHQKLFQATVAPFHPYSKVSAPTRTKRANHLAIKGKETRNSSSDSRKTKP